MAGKKMITTAAASKLMDFCLKQKKMRKTPDATQAIRKAGQNYIIHLTEKISSEITEAIAHRKTVYGEDVAKYFKLQSDLIV